MRQGVLVANRRARSFGPAMHAAARFARHGGRLARCPFAGFRAAARAGPHRFGVASMRAHHLV